jgi:hypothetical protein
MNGICRTADWDSPYWVPLPFWRTAVLATELGSGR